MPKLVVEAPIEQADPKSKQDDTTTKTFVFVPSNKARKPPKQGINSKKNRELRLKSMKELQKEKRALRIYCLRVTNAPMPMEVDKREEDAQYVGEALFYNLDSVEVGDSVNETDVCYVSSQSSSMTNEYTEESDTLVCTSLSTELAESGNDSIPSVSTADLAELAILQEDVAAEVEEVEYLLIGTTIQDQVIAQLGEDDEHSELLEEDAQVFFPPGEGDATLDHEVSEEDAHYVGAALFCRETKKKQPRREKILDNLDGAYWTAMPKRRVAKRKEGGVISSPTLRRSARIAALH